MMFALDEVAIAGLHHTTAFLRDVIASEQFARGELSTHFVDEHFKRLALRSSSNEKAALIAAALVDLARAWARASRAVTIERERKNRAAATIRHGARLAGFQLWERR